MDKTAFAPGCFGSPLAFGSSDEVCVRCPFYGECGARKADAMQALRDLMSVTVAPKARTPSDQMSVAARKVFDKLGQTAEEILSAILEGRNPFNKRKGFLWDACQTLGGEAFVTRALLAETLAYRLGIQESVADLYARQAVQILRHCGAVTVKEDRISLVTNSK